MKEDDIQIILNFYLDTSAIAKRYCREAGTHFINSLYENVIRTDQIIYFAEHTISEVGSTIYRKMREGKFDAEESTTLLTHFLMESKSSIQFIETNESLYLNTFDFLKKYTLRSADAIHLAAAFEVYKLHGNNLFFISDDKKQCEAASSEGLRVVLPSDSNSLDYIQHVYGISGSS